VTRIVNTCWTFQQLIALVIGAPATLLVALYARLCQCRPKRGSRGNLNRWENHEEHQCLAHPTTRSLSP
jgi:hypothetical protein